MRNACVSDEYCEVVGGLLDEEGKKFLFYANEADLDETVTIPMEIFQR